MKHYGFHPFIVAEKAQKAGVIYDLLRREKYVVSPEICDCFSGSYFKSRKEIDLILNKYNPQNIDEIITNGINSGIIVETDKNYFRKEIVNDFFVAKRRQSLLKKLTIQPTGKCNLSCNECEKYYNCLCQRNTKSWSKDELIGFAKELKNLENNVEELNLIGGDLLEFEHMNLLLDQLKSLHFNIISFNFKMESIPYLNKLYEFVDKLKNIKSPLLIRLQVHLKQKHQTTHEYHPEIKSFLEHTKNKGITVCVDLMADFSDKSTKHLLDEIEGQEWHSSIVYLYPKNVEKINKIRTNVEMFTEDVDLDDFYFRKIAHRCWGYSISISSEGAIKPCLWSKKSYGNWDGGEFKHVVLDPEISNRFWLECSIDTLGSLSCKACTLRYCCNHCQVLEEHEPNIFKKLCSVLASS